MFKKQENHQLPRFLRAEPVALTVFYDGSCVLCRTFAERFSKLTPSIPVKWEGVIPSTPMERATLRFRVTDDGGRIFYDTDARLALLWAFPQYRFIARTLSHPSLRWLVNIVFQMIAAHRYKISNVLITLGLGKQVPGHAGTCDAHCQFLNSPKE